MIDRTGNVSQIPWLPIAAEGAVVVASILLALAIDTWWAERQERREERDEPSRNARERAQDSADRVLAAISAYLEE